MRLIRWANGPILQALGVAVVLASGAPSASADPLRNPQVVFPNGALQSFLSSGVHAGTDQLDKPVWTAAELGGYCPFSIALRNKTRSLALGLYDASAAMPTLFAIFPDIDAITADWYATLHFGADHMSVALFDINGVYEGSVSFTGVDPLHLGIYVHDPVSGATYDSEDARNASGAPQVLT